MHSFSVPTVYTAIFAVSDALLGFAKCAEESDTNLLEYAVRALFACRVSVPMRWL